MTDIHITEDIYSVVRKVTGELERIGFVRPAAILTHRMTKVAWTTSGDLLDELLKVFALIQSEYAELPATLREEITSLCESIRRIKR